VTGISNTFDIALTIYNQNGKLYNPTFKSAYIMWTSGALCPSKDNIIEPGEKDDN
jgi:hypothetical protein